VSVFVQVSGELLHCCRETKTIIIIIIIIIELNFVSGTLHVFKQRGKAFLPFHNSSHNYCIVVLLLVDRAAFSVGCDVAIRIFTILAEYQDDVADDVARSRRTDAPVREHFPIAVGVFVSAIPFRFPRVCRLEMVKHGRNCVVARAACRFRGGFALG
jgi:hypothetical protein